MLFYLPQILVSEIVACLNVEMFAMVAMLSNYLWFMAVYLGDFIFLQSYCRLMESALKVITTVITGKEEATHFRKSLQPTTGSHYSCFECYQIHNAVLNSTEEGKYHTCDIGSEFLWNHSANM